MEFGGGGDDGEHFRDDPEWLRRLAETHRLVGGVLCREAEPNVLILDRSQPPLTFELAYGEPDEAPPPSSNPLVNYDTNDRDSYANVLVGSANYMMEEFLDAWAANQELEDRVLRHAELSDTTDYNYAVARRNGYFNGPPETASLSLNVWSIDLIGGNLDGVSIDRVTINSHDDCAHLFIITNNDEVCFSYIHDRNQHPLVKECVDFLVPVHTSFVY